MWGGRDEGSHTPFGYYGSGPPPPQPLYVYQYRSAYPGGYSAPPGIYPSHTAQYAPAAPPSAFDEELQERKKKGKEMVPFGAVPYPDRSTFGRSGIYRRPGRDSQSRAFEQPPPSQPKRGYGEFADKSRPLPRAAATVNWVHGNDPYHVPEPALPAPASGTSAFGLSRRVDLILSPSSGDRTVHLAMEIEVDLEEQLEEMSRLCKLGHFSSARKFFDGNLRHHMDKDPYVVIQYADLLLHQGSFKEVILLRSAANTALYELEESLQDSNELRALRISWELMQVMASSHTHGALGDVSSILSDAAHLLHETVMIDKPISSTEIQILGLVLYLSCHPALDSQWLRYRTEILHALPGSIPVLYRYLLRQGRIWDFHGLLVSLPTMEDIKLFTHAIFKTNLVPSLQTVITDWTDSVHEYDSVTMLGLLSILTHILLKPLGASERECVDIFKLCLPLAQSVMENDPGNLKTRPYLRVLLAKSRFAETASRQAMDVLARELGESPGIFYYPDIARLPVYVPTGSEVPAWTPQDQPAELKEPVMVVLRSVVDLGDWDTEVLVRQELVRLSSDPASELDRICALQLHKQVDISGYAASLAAKLLVSGERLDKRKMGEEISTFLSKVGSTAYLDASYRWILIVLQHTLEGKSASSIKYELERGESGTNDRMEEPLLREILDKIPTSKEWRDRIEWQIARKKRQKEVGWGDGNPFTENYASRYRTREVWEQNRRISPKPAPNFQKNNFPPRRPPPGVEVSSVTDYSERSNLASVGGEDESVEEELSLGDQDANVPSVSSDERKPISDMQRMLDAALRSRDEKDDARMRQQQKELKEILEMFKNGTSQTPPLLPPRRKLSWCGLQLLPTS
ncbi:hypothetical protein F5Y17DRAFT_251932 [Xylariaceae sp. FL0594]|nr:hypothetical protein F5Y17DRAFT_251932 [Xylariaceae sp. FL0594]